MSPTPLREVAAHDPSRPFPHWTASIGVDEFAVRYFDPRTNCTVGSDGQPLDHRNNRVLVFATRDDAERYCHAAIERTPKTGCLIYDSNGTLVSTHVDQRRAAELAKPPSRTRLLVKGLLLLMIGSALIWWDWNRRFTIMIGILLGIRMVVAALILFWRALRQKRG
jgi:hypothetical protein